MSRTYWHRRRRGNVSMGRCDKLAFSSAREAWDHARAFERQTGSGARVYWCDADGAWHITTHEYPGGGRNHWTRAS